MPMSNWLIGAGVILIGIGILYKFGLLHWFGNLPGDMKYEGENVKIYFPIVTMIVMSIALSLFLSIFRK